MSFFRRFSNRAPSSYLSLGGAGLAALLATGFQTSPAGACGGFFCSQAAPVNQAAEKIVFSHNGDGTVTSIIQILYQGPAESFAWVLPVPGVPEVDVSSDAAIALIERMTDPQYNLDRRIEGTCIAEQVRDFDDAPTSAADGLGTVAAEPDSAPPPQVIVEADGAVGPFDWVVISVVPEADDAVGVALEWLEDNGYDVGDLGPDVLRPYLEEGLNLLAFKLTKGNDAGSIRPVRITYESDVPMIPIRPTAVAANEDMGILAWVLGESQAIPNNYLSLVLNEALVDWFSWRRNYNDLVSIAADESGGQGFVTEFAGSSEKMSGVIFTENNAANWATIAEQEYATGYDAIQAAQSYYRNWDGWRDAIGAATTLPEGVTLEEFGRSPTTYRDDPGLVIDTSVFLQALYDLVVGPMQETQELFDAQPYLTRFYTTMSPLEMSLDPSFDFNADLADVNNVHRATQVISCNKDVYLRDAPFVIEIPGVGTVEGDSSRPNTWPIELTKLPATRKIVELGTSGAGEVVEDNSALISDVLGVVLIENPEAVEPEEGELVPIGGIDEMMPAMTTPPSDSEDEESDEKTEPEASGDTQTDELSVEDKGDNSATPKVEDDDSDDTAKSDDSSLDSDDTAGESDMQEALDEVGEPAATKSSSGGGCALAAPSPQSGEHGSALALFGLLGLAALRRRR